MCRDRQGGIFCKKRKKINTIKINENKNYVLLLFFLNIPTSGRDVLLEGGAAMDAALASLLCMGAVHPHR